MFISKLHPKTALDHQEQLVISIVVMPHERSLEFDQFHLLAVQFANDFRLPMLLDERQFLYEVHLFHAQL